MPRGPGGVSRVAHGACPAPPLSLDHSRSATRSSAPTCAPTCSSSATSSPSSGPSSYHHSPSFSRTRVTPERGAVGSGRFAKVRKKEPIDFAQKLLERPNFSQKIPGCPMMAFCSGAVGQSDRGAAPKVAQQGRAMVEGSVEVRAIHYMLRDARAVDHGMLPYSPGSRGAWRSQCPPRRSRVGLNVAGLRPTSIGQAARRLAAAITRSATHARTRPSAPCDGRPANPGQARPRPPHRRNPPRRATG